MFGVGPPELLIIGVVAVLLFGKRLPEVARSLGQSYNQFRRGLHDIQSEVNQAIHSEPSSSSATKSLGYSDDDYDEPTAPKFTPPTESA
jgi:sec-independent protein translocase protein TatA